MGIGFSDSNIRSSHAIYDELNEKDGEGFEMIGILGIGLLIGCLGVWLMKQPPFQFQWNGANDFVFPLTSAQTSWRDGLFQFAAGNDSGEKTEKASHKKIQDARKKGQVPKSGDINNFATLLGAFGLLLFLGPKFLQEGRLKMSYYLSHSYERELVAQYQTLFLEGVSFFLIYVVGLFLPLMLVGVVANIAQTGFLFTLEPLKPQFSKLNPVSGFKEMFSRKRWFELAKNILKLTVVSAVTLLFLKKQQALLLEFSYLNLMEGLTAFGQITKGLIQQIVVTVGVIAAVDYGFQRFDFSKDMKMTKQEVKEEFKQMEGDPNIKGQRRQKQRELLNGNLTQTVPEATVIVTNPTHFAVALKWEMDSGQLPKVVAKGMDLRAQTIKELAKEHDVPMIENRPLARSLYKLVEVDQDIPPELFEAVSQVIAIVIRMQEKKRKKYRY